MMKIQTNGIAFSANSTLKGTFPSLKALTHCSTISFGAVDV
jgi:hypothetical protein